MTPFQRVAAPVRMTLLTALLLLATAHIAGAIDGKGPVRMWVDYAAFRYAPDSRDGYVEFYYELKRVDFQFHVVDSLLRADVYTWVHVRDSAGHPVDSVGGAFVSIVQDSTEIADSTFTIFFARALLLHPGEYTARMVVADLITKHSSEADFPIRVPDFSARGLTLSDIQLGYDIINRRMDTVEVYLDVLEKNRYKVYPDCRGLISQSRSLLFLYTEAYNLDYGPSRDNSYDLTISVVPGDTGVPRPLSVQRLTKPGTTAVLATGVNTRGLAPGAYRLRIDLKDLASGQQASAQKGFYVVPPLIVDSLTDEEIQRIRDIISYIAHPGELQTFERLNMEGKRAFWVQFWKDRDPTPGTPENEFKDEHLQRMNYANERFSVGYQKRSDGWRTDMGRVYIVYGPPSTAERFPFTAQNPPAEMWFYDNMSGQGQVYFLFIDESGYGEYNLVTSSARGEQRNPAWERQVQAGAFERKQ